MKIERFLRALHFTRGGPWSVDAAGRLRDAYGRCPLLAVADDGQPTGYLSLQIVRAIDHAADHADQCPLRTWLLRATGLESV